MSRRKIIQIYIALLLVLLLGIRSFYIRHPVLTGKTMGTEYSVTIKGYVLRSSLNELRQKIEDELAVISLQMSTWDPDSEISQFNASEELGPFPVTMGFADVVIRALEFAHSTSGAFDPTLQPLVNLWGFGSDSEERKVPSNEEIERALAVTGADMVWVEDSTNLWKAAPEVMLDLGAIAKGHGVDVISRLLGSAGYENRFVEIGGEVQVAGLNPEGQPWRIGIQHPSYNPLDDQLHGVLHLTNGAVATSGDYRNYVEHEDRMYAHIIEPWTGQAVSTNTASVTVFAPNCLDADAAATALFVLGAEEGMVWVEEHPDAEAMFLVREDDGEITTRFSSGFEAAAGYIPADRSDK